MRHVRLLVILLLVATLLVDLVVLSAVVATHPLVPADWPHPAAVALYALCMAQVGLVAVWTGFGGKSLPWRILSLVLTIGLSSRLLAWAVDPSDHVPMVTTWSCLLLAQSVVILLPLGAARLRGVRLVRAGNGHPSKPVAPGRGPFQFSLGYLLSWITVLAVILGLAQYTFPFQEVLTVLALAPWVLPLFALNHGGLVLGGLWAALGTGRLRSRCLVLVLTTGAAIVAHQLWPDSQDCWLYVAVCVLQVLWVTASLSVFRVAGYRMTRAARARAAEPPAAPDAG